MARRWGARAGDKELENGGGWEETMWQVVKRDTKMRKRKK
jgi:hypothetical protein